MTTKITLIKRNPESVRDNMIEVGNVYRRKISGDLYHVVTMIEHFALISMTNGGYWSHPTKKIDKIFGNIGASGFTFVDKAEITID